MTGPLITRVVDEWVLARYGVLTPQFLSTSGTWSGIGDAAWFTDQATAHAALCPPGTSGVAVHMPAASRTSEAAGAGIVASVRKAFNELAQNADVRAPGLRPPRGT